MEKISFDFYFLKTVFICAAGFLALVGKKAKENTVCTGDNFPYVFSSGDFFLKESK